MSKAEPDVEKMYETFTERGWSDGLPMIPPTKDRVNRMLEFTDKDPDESIGKMPPSNDEALIRLVAANAVMAGCKPEYFPVVVTAIECTLNRPNLRGALCTTHPTWPVSIVNGPIAKEININSSWGLFGTGPQFRANLTIGRAITLCIQNIGDVTPGVTEKKPVGTLLRYGVCFAENENESPWEPLHVEKGFDRNTSTVTVIADINQPQIAGDHSYGLPTTELLVIAKNLAWMRLPGVKMVKTEDLLLLISPNFARVLSDAGWTKEDVKRFLYEYARMPKNEMWSSYPPELREKLLQRWHAPASLPKWIREGNTAPIVAHPDNICLVVAGAPVVLCPSAIFFRHFAHTDFAVTKPVALADGTPAKSIRAFKRAR